MPFVLPRLKSLVCLSALLGMSFLSACQSDEMRLHGHMEKIQHEGQTCWIFIDDDHKAYEVITPSELVLKENLQMSIKAYEVERQTLCQLPTVIDIVAFRPDFAKDM